VKPRASAGWLVAAAALAGMIAWPFVVAQRTDLARADALPTMAPVTRDYEQRDKLVAFWEGAVAEHHRGDMLSPSQLSGQYLQRYREQGDIDDVLRSERAAQLSLKALPGNRTALIELAAVYLTLHRFYDALAIIHRAERNDARDPALELREASLDLEVGRYDQARELIDRTPRTSETAVTLDTIRSRYLEETGHLTEARDLLHEAGAMQNANFEAPAQGRAWFFFRAGEMAFESGDVDGAIANERTALEVFPNFADASRSLARFECATHRWQACLADAERSASIVPYPETLGFEADAYRALGDAAAAMRTEDLIATIERIGNAQHISDRLLAVYYSEHGERLHDAYRIARHELALRDDIYTEDTLAWAAAMDGRWSEARAAARKATRFDTEDSRLQYHAALIALHWGDRSEAKARLERALSLNPQFHPVYADEARAELARLN
jgi:tetratricopeptide (TPR) repeat protein